MSNPETLHELSVAMRGSTSPRMRGDVEDRVDVEVHEFLTLRGLGPICVRSSNRRGEQRTRILGDQEVQLALRIRDRYVVHLVHDDHDVTSRVALAWMRPGA